MISPVQTDSSTCSTLRVDDPPPHRSWIGLSPVDRPQRDRAAVVGRSTSCACAVEIAGGGAPHHVSWRNFLSSEELR
jgi:hypothetical protein